MLLPEEIIRAKRDGQTLATASIKSFVNGITAGQVSDAQVGAFAMAVHFQGMSMTEQTALTLAMRDSGRCLSWPDLNGPVLDKHSTGGVGDLVSLVLAPIMAACGAYVPMISGRGLGHTGGTLDKLESIPGFNVNLTAHKFDQCVRETGLAMVGQGADLAPADGRIYAIRGVTATVDSCPLIVASILSKKLAEGLDGLVLDIKTGNGAFMRERNRARDLAENLVEASTLAGLACRAVITDMNQPLASSAGNALEMLDAIAFLKNEASNARLAEVVRVLCCELLILGKLVTTNLQAGELFDRVLQSGKAVEHFARMIALQGGPADVMEHPLKYLPSAPVVRPLRASTNGCVAFIDNRAIGLCVVALGGGRKHVADQIDHRVGLSGLRDVGDMVNNGDVLTMIHAVDESAWQAAAQSLDAAIVVGRKTDGLPAVYEQFASSNQT